MKLLNGFLSSFTKKGLNENIAAEFIFYKIVHFSEKDNKYLLQCINTKATFFAKINDIIIDKDILYGLHPIQACYIGIEYAVGIKNNKQAVIFSDKDINSYSYYRYGTLALRYQNRKKNLCFFDLKTQKEFIMDPRDIALSEQLICEFDAIQAFYIGFSAGLNMNNPEAIYESRNKNNQPRLVLIKNSG